MFEVDSGSNTRDETEAQMELEIKEDGSSKLKYPCPKCDESFSLKVDLKVGRKLLLPLKMWYTFRSFLDRGTEKSGLLQRRDPNLKPDIVFTKSFLFKLLKTTFKNRKMLYLYVIEFGK